jgi:hypothetical protein
MSVYVKKVNFKLHESYANANRGTMVLLMIVLIYKVLYLTIKRGLSSSDINNDRLQSAGYIL